METEKYTDMGSFKYTPSDELLYEKWCLTMLLKTVLFMQIVCVFKMLLILV